MPISEAIGSSLKASFTISEEFCDKYPHTLVSTPGYWIECSRAISDQGSALTIDERELQEVDEGVSNSPDGSIRDVAVADNSKEEVHRWETFR